MPGCFGYGDIDSWMARNLDNYLDSEYGDDEDDCDDFDGERDGECEE